MQTAQIGKAGRWNLTKANLWYDLVIFVGALLAPAVMLTGLAIHEWLGIALGIAIIGHLLLHWSWITQVTRRFFGKLPWSSRLNYIVNGLFFVTLTVIIFTGIMMSEVVLPQLGIQLPRDMTWRMLHTLASDFIVFVLAAHVALHWKWILNAANRYMVQPALRPMCRPAPSQQPALIEKEGVA